MPSSYPSGRFSLIVLRTALSAARGSAGSAARYWATVEAVMLATIPVLRSARPRIPTSDDGSRAIRVRPSTIAENRNHSFSADSKILSFQSLKRRVDMEISVLIQTRCVDHRVVKVDGKAAFQ